MAEKEIWLDGVRIFHGTSIKVSKNTNTTTTTTFDEVVNGGTANISYSIDCSKVAYDTEIEYLELEDKLEEMLETPSMITIREVRKPPAPNDPFVVVRNYHDCLVDGGDFEIKPEDLTVENLKFKTGRHTKNDRYTEPYNPQE